MTAIQDTAYPRIRSSLTMHELAQVLDCCVLPFRNQRVTLHAWDRLV